MSSPLTLWHVTCGHSRENGCYGYESANNENAPGDSGPCRNYPSAPATPEARSIPYSIALARHPYHCSQTQTDHRRRYARAARYSASRKDHSFAPRSGASSFSHHDCHGDRDSGRFLVRKSHFTYRSRHKGLCFVSLHPAAIRLLQFSQIPGSN
jgi:hypothetical protein